MAHGSLLSISRPGHLCRPFRATDSLGNVTQRNVTFTLTTATLSNVATLSNLVPGTGSLSPAFDSSTPGYSMTVSGHDGFHHVDTHGHTSGGHGVDQWHARALRQHTPTLPLAAGDNLINVVVTAENGVATKTYAVTVTRPSPFF